VVGDDGLKVERKTPAFRAPDPERRPVGLDRRGAEASVRQLEVAEDLQQVGVADGVQETQRVAAFPRDPVSLRIPPGGDRRRPAPAPAPRRRAGSAGSLSGTLGKSEDEGRSMGTVIARPPSRSIASGTVPTELSRSTDRALARIIRSSVRYGSRAAIGTTAAGSTGDFFRSSMSRSDVSS